MKNTNITHLSKTDIFAPTPTLFIDYIGQWATTKKFNWLVPENDSAGHVWRILIQDFIL